MLFWMTVFVIITLLLVAGFLHFLGSALAELEHHFMPIIGIILLFIIGAATYLSFAVPSMARMPGKTDGGSVTIQRDTVKGMPLIEEESSAD